MHLGRRRIPYANDSTISAPAMLWTEKVPNTNPNWKKGAKAESRLYLGRESRWTWGRKESGCKILKILWAIASESLTGPIFRMDCPSLRNSEASKVWLHWASQVSECSLEGAGFIGNLRCLLFGFVLRSWGIWSFNPLYDNNFYHQWARFDLHYSFAVELQSQA